ncbi:hypothetical protein [Aliarcobacter skirrowii]|uniref:hypothetical protein n=1 Tax=Aliarcobacter skirrowii TaxID=28200 RepID=UPI0029BD22A0|nr:hypothetical protein [Aliarcobacter skirrowii]MDX3960318.1 hypothetical protein [Aliarcobacter skirrowii]MDX4035988.1 hypothetical protein [Aliarcobacter skirrowii]MDX4064867.1 hypothetical protein [Aliarcobacter skirrowii]MDX4070336.1 hypothetical protein [Aliarcobacter skirrowii]
MILAIKKKRKIELLIKKVVLISLLFILFSVGFGFYNKLLLKNEELKAQEEQEILLQLEKERLEKQKAEIEFIILEESSRVVDLIGQKYIDDIKVYKNKLVYILKPNTNIDAITIRYGSFALVKRSFKEIVVVIDLENILKGKIK